MCERNDVRTKASLGVGKSMTKIKGSLRSQRSIIEYTALIKTVLIDERSISNKGGYRGIKMVVKVQLDSYQEDNTPKGGALRQFPCCW